MNINVLLLEKLNQLTIYPEIKYFTILMADLPIFLLPIFLVTWWIYFSIKKNNEQKKKLLYILYSSIIWLIISILIQQFIHIDRPENYLNNSSTFILQHLPDASFPSDHASVSFAFLSSMFLFWYKKILLLFLPFILIMNLSRIIAWVHFPLDILTWLIIGIFSWYISYKYLSKSKIINHINNLTIKNMNYIKL